MPNFKIIWQCLLPVTSISLQYNSTLAACTVRFLPDWNSVMEGMITICTILTVLTKFIHNILKRNILVLLNICYFCPKCKTVSVNSGKCFQNTTEMETPWSINGDKYSDNAPFWMTHTYQGIRIADYNGADTSLDHICDWMSYCIHHSKMDAPQYVHVDIPSVYMFYWMFYYTLHIDMDAPQYVHADVPSVYMFYWMFY